jgi:hypothetical protein
VALSTQQLGALVGLGLPWAQMNLPPTVTNQPNTPGLYIAAGMFPVIVLIDVPPALPIPPVSIPFTLQSRVGVVNLALTGKLGQERIESFDDDSKAATLAKSNFDRILDQELARYRWYFAIERRAIAASSDVPWGPWKYSYSLPADCLTLLWVGPYEPADVGDLDPDGEWSVEGPYIRTNFGAPLPVTYIKRVLEPGLWHSLFLEVLACRLGMEFSIPLCSSLKLWEKCQAEYKDAIREARRVSAIQNPPRVKPEDPWITARH